MRFLCGYERRFNANVNYDGSAFKPRASAFRKFRGLRYFGEAEDANEERARLIFASYRHGKLHVIEAERCGV